MQYLIIGFFLHLLIVAPPVQGYAGVAEASINSEHHHSMPYDLSGLSERERDWFLTFIKGNILAEGWGRITDNLLRHVTEEEQRQQRLLLIRLGTKIGREWCRDNHIRRIDNSMLREWGSQLKNTAKNEPQRLAELIRDIDCEVDSLLN